MDRLLFTSLDCGNGLVFQMTHAQVMSPLMITTYHYEEK